MAGLIWNDLLFEFSLIGATSFTSFSLNFHGSWVSQSFDRQESITKQVNPMRRKEKTVRFILHRGIVLPLFDWRKEIHLVSIFIVGLKS